MAPFASRGKYLIGKGLLEEVCKFKESINGLPRNAGRNGSTVSIEAALKPSSG